MILVTGATGAIGRPLVNELVSMGEQVRAITHHSTPAGLPRDIELIEGDFSRPDTIVPALADITALFVHPRAGGMAAPTLLRLPPPPRGQKVVGLSAGYVDAGPADQP